MNYRNIDIIYSRDHTSNFFTKGLIKFIGRDLKVLSKGDEQGTTRLLQYLIDYILDYRPLIKANETISYGLWLLKFVREEEFFEIFELDDYFKDWIQGAENAIYYLDLQKKACEIENAEFSLPKFSQKIAVSEGVLDGLPVQGIRYKEPDHMSGWYLTTSLYNGKIATMRVVPLQELVVARKDLIEFMALPPNYVFQTFEDHSCQIWKVSNIADDLRSN